MKFLKCTWPNCQRTASSTYNLKRHIRIVHERDRSYVCTKPDCSAAFSTSQHLKRHILSAHITVKECDRRNCKYKCQSCKKGFYSNDVLRRHRKTVHGECDQSDGSSNTILKPSFICAQCDRNFTRKDVLISHIFCRHHSDEIVHYECHHCSRKFIRKDGLKRHILSKHKTGPLRKDDVYVLLLEENEVPATQELENNIIPTDHVMENSFDPVFDDMEISNSSVYTIEEIIIPDDLDVTSPPSPSESVLNLNQAQKTEVLKKFSYIGEKISNTYERDVAYLYLNNLDEILFGENATKM